MRLTAAEIGAALFITERLLCGAVLACVGAGLRTAADEGVDSLAFLSPDHRWIYRACEATRERDRALPLAKIMLIHAGEWGAWNDETLVELGMMFYGRPAPVRELCRALTALWLDWEVVAVDYVPKYADTGALNYLDPLRTGMALVRLSEWSGVPLDWIHSEFARVCERRDGMGWARGIIQRLRAVA